MSRRQRVFKKKIKPTLTVPKIAQKNNVCLRVLSYRNGDDNGAQKCPYEVVFKGEPAPSEIKLNDWAVNKAKQKAN